MVFLKQVPTSLIYYIYYIKKLFMAESIYNFCLLFINSSNMRFKVISLQTDNIFILAYNIFLIIKKKQLNEVKLLAKNKEKLTYNILIKFNRSNIKLTADNSIFFSWKK